MQFNVTTLLASDSAGEACVLPEGGHKPLFGCTATAVTLAYVYTIDRELLLELGVREDGAVLAALAEQWRQRSPLQQDVRLFLRRKAKWERDKQRVLADLKRS
jgi:hypothetical protein